MFSRNLHAAALSGPSKYLTVKWNICQGNIQVSKYSPLLYGKAVLRSWSVLVGIVTSVKVFHYTDLPASK